jgi:hypothetical protein
VREPPPISRQNRRYWRCEACGKGGSVLVQERTDHPSKALRFAVACHLIQDECDAILPAHRMIAGVIVLASASVAEPIEESNHPIPMGRIPMGPDIAAAGGPYIRPSGSALSTTGSGRRGSRSMPSGG